MSNDISARDSTTSQHLPIADQPMNPQAAANEFVLRALTEAAQRVFDKYGLRLDGATFEWNELPAVNGSRFVVRKVTIRSTMRTVVKMR